MKGTEKIIAHIQTDAGAKANEILARAEEQCAAIREEYRKKAEETYKECIRNGVKEAEGRNDSLKRIAGMEARKGLLAVKQEMVTGSFDRAVGALVSIPEERYVAFLVKLISEAAVTKDEEVVLNSRDRETVGARVVSEANAKLGGKLTLSDATGDFAGGLILRRENIEVNCTAELLVDLQRGDMSAELAKVLFE